jgi:Ca-activated chloride channel family protein
VFWWIVVLAVVGFTLLQLQQRKRQTTIQLPHVHLYPKYKGPLRIISKVLFVGSIFFICWAAIHWSVGSGFLERIFISEKSRVYPSPTSSRALFFVIDRSGSMNEPLGNISKMDAVKEGVKGFLGGERGDDLFGLISFARAAMVQVPLSRDRAFFEHSLANISPETEDRYNGTALGYAIFKSVCLIEACRQFSKAEKEHHFIGQAVIVITDGLEEPHPADRSHPFRSMPYERALQYARERNVRVHYLNIDKKSYEKMPFIDRDNLRRLVETTGGVYGEVSLTHSLEKLLSRVAEKEEYQQVEKEPRSSSLGWALIAWALIFCSLSRLLESTILRVIQ